MIDNMGNKDGVYDIELVSSGIFPVYIGILWNLCSANVINRGGGSTYPRLFCDDFNMVGRANFID